MRIVAGEFKGRTVRTPPGNGTRPTSDRVRESLFSSLESLGMLDDAVVLDLFAGSGSLGLEALSRGARHVTFVEKAASVVRVLEGNLKDLGVHGSGGSGGAGTARTTVQARSALAAVQGLAPGTVDLVLADPPYPLGESDVAALLEALVPVLRDAASLIVLERSARSPRPTLPAGLSVYEERTKGETSLWLLERTREE
ncbi:16S rRNA (guanine(966)-N(2))-methyltransferase RsmD [Brevibacterium litoralis]|uniref:16S rRNA (guanine(966)-N(2))-methyltransferase RsmD n=1 Tax=Brevibacterium litoralis TaxID=3138935 RepID=UPI0032ED700F